MPEEIKRKRGRPPKQQIVETNQSSITEETIDKSFEFNTYNATTGINSIFSCGVYDYFSKDEIDAILRDPITNHATAIKLSNFVYNKNGIVSNSIDYMTSLMCLDRVITNKSKKPNSKTQSNKELFKSTLNKIGDKSFIRDALFTQMTEGIAFFYFETTAKSQDKTKFLTDYEVENICEINELGINASIITLPWQYTKIVGKKNGRYVLAFNLRYFDDFTGEKLENKLKKYPKEISDAYSLNRTKDWCVLDSDKTLCKKIKCKNTEPWGRSLIIAALSDVLYKDYFVDTKRNTLDEINNKVVTQTLPEGEKKGTCSLSKTQQENQHATVKQAVMTKNSRGGTTFVTVAAGTKLDTLDTSSEIFDEKNESNLDNQISMDLGICASLIGAMSTGNFSAGTLNIEMITSQIYTWVCEWANELNYIINKNIIKDDKNAVEVYYFPTSFVNREKFFGMMKDLYTSAGGSLTFLIASTGIDADVYLATLDSEIENGYFEKYLPHLTSSTISKEDDVGGRPTGNNPDANKGGNIQPSPSDN